jgi:hypothetical protein
MSTCNKFEEEPDIGKVALALPQTPVSLPPAPSAPVNFKTYC